MLKILAINMYNIDAYVYNLKRIHPPIRDVGDMKRESAADLRRQVDELRGEVERLREVLSGLTSLILEREMERIEEDEHEGLEKGNAGTRLAFTRLN